MKRMYLIGVCRKGDLALSHALLGNVMACNHFSREAHKLISLTTIYASYRTNCRGIMVSRGRVELESTG